MQSEIAHEWGGLGLSKCSVASSRKSSSEWTSLEKIQLGWLTTIL